MTSLNKRIAVGASWTVALRFGERLLGLVSTLVLARLLAPEDFGLIAMGTVLLTALETLTAFGFEVALIQRRTRDPALLNSAWTLNAILGAANAVMLLAIAPVAAWFYSEDRVFEIVAVLALSAILHGIENIGMVLFEQELQFSRIFGAVVFRKVIGVIITIGAAVIFHDYRALLVGIVTTALAGTIATYILSQYRPRFSLSHWRELVNFSKWLLANNMLHFLATRGGDFIVGRLAGPSALGTFSISYELANLPTSELVAPITRAVFPGYTQIASDTAKLQKAFLAVYGVIGMFAIPSGIGIYTLANPLVAVLLGTKWTAAVPVIQALALYGVTRALQANTGSLYLAVGKPYLMTMLAAFYVVVALVSFGASLSFWGLEKAVWAYFAAGSITWILNISTAVSVLKLGMRQVVSPLVRPVLAATAMLLVLTQAMAGTLLDPSITPDWTSLLVGTAVGALTYICTILALWKMAGCPPGAESHLLRLFSGKVHASA